jgi:hypothetical protein
MVKKIRRAIKAMRKSHGKEFYPEPGTIIVDENAEQPIIFLIDYNQTDLIQKQISYPEECLNYLDTESVSWVDVQGLGSKDILHRLGQTFDLHPLRGCFKSLNSYSLGRLEITATQTKPTLLGSEPLIFLSLHLRIAFCRNR